MTNVTGSLPVADPDADDLTHQRDRVELTASGLIRLWNGEQRYRLRRPFFGQFKALRVGLEDVQDAIHAKQTDTEFVGVQIKRRMDQMNEEVTADADMAAFRGELADLSKESRRVARELTDFADEQRIGWWRDVFDAVSLDGPLPEDEEELPAWILDLNLPHEALKHWRSVPLDRGRTGPAR